MAHAIDALARRHLEPLDWPGHEVSQETLDHWLVDWYTGYCAAVLELAEAAQAASKSGALKLRSARTRALLADGLNGWPGADLRAEAQSAKLFYECAQWGPLDAQWPDGLPMPPGCVSPEDADAWAAGAGVAQPGALLALLDIVAEGEQAATAEPLTAPAGGAVHSPMVPTVAPEVLKAAELPPGFKKWTPERLKELRDYRTTHGTKRAAAWAKISEARVRELLPSGKPATKGFSVFTHRAK